MTSTVKIEAHCSENTEVHVCMPEMGSNLNLTIPSIKLKNGETETLYVYGNEMLLIYEQEKGKQYG